MDYNDFTWTTTSVTASFGSINSGMAFCAGGDCSASSPIPGSGESGEKKTYGIGHGVMKGKRSPLTETEAYFSKGDGAAYCARVISVRISIPHVFTSQGCTRIVYGCLHGFSNYTGRYNQLIVWHLASM